MTPVLAAVALLLSTQTGDSTLRPAIAAALAIDSIETTDSIVAQPTLLGVLAVDLDGDGRREAVAWLGTVIRQTATIAVFRQEADGSWKRSPEGLAPGRLRPPSDDRVDLHTMGLAVDFGMEGKSDSTATGTLLSKGLSTGMSLVGYPSFFHADMRHGSPSMVDLRTWAGLAVGAVTCEAIEFAEPQEVVAGRLAGAGAKEYLVALTIEDVTIYRIDGFQSNGFLMKKVWILPRMPGPAHLSIGADGTVLLQQSEATSQVALP